MAAACSRFSSLKTVSFGRGVMRRSELVDAAYHFRSLGSSMSRVPAALHCKFVAIEK